MKNKIVTAFAPATVANVGVGFDILGFALSGLGETASVEKIENSKQVHINPIKGYPEISIDPLKNTATAGLVRLIREKNLAFGFKVKLKKEIPVGSGLGGSSTSAVASLIAANSFLKVKLTRSEILDYALTGEEVASGARHADNIAPCIEGGLVLVPTNSTIPPIGIKTPPSLRCVILLPELSIHTKEARQILASAVPLSTMIQQTFNLAGFILGCQNADFDLIRLSLKDVVIEPQRSHLVPHFLQIQAAAMAAGALGCSLSGSGPALFAFARNQKSAEEILKKMKKAALHFELPLRGTWISPIAKKGAFILREKR